MPKTKALVLFSGGLDSVLAAMTLVKQDIEVELVCFVSNFYNAENAKKTAQHVGLKLHILSIENEIIGVVKNPPSGLGKNMNPCIDCHALMIKTANEKLGKGFDFIATGEVLGQRPFSQNRTALDRVRKLAGVEILRPLSAKLLDETDFEKSGIVDRSKLHEISGRGREAQFELAKQYSITVYPTPAGGCLLTDPGFSDRLRDMIANWPECTASDIELLKHGRIYWLTMKEENILVVVGRQSADNENLLKFKQKNDIIFQLKDIVGPIVLLRSKNNSITTDDDEILANLEKNITIEDINIGSTMTLEEILHTASLLTAWHSKRAHGHKNTIILNKIK